MKWITALKAWNSQKGGAWCVPRKGTPEHAQVLSMMGGGAKAEKKEDCIGCEDKKAKTAKEEFLAGYEARKAAAEKGNAEMAAKRSAALERYRDAEAKKEEKKHRKKVGKLSDSQKEVVKSHRDKIIELLKEMHK